MPLALPHPDSLQADADAERQRLKEAGDARGLTALAASLRTLCRRVEIVERRAKSDASYIRYKQAQEGPPTFDFSASDLQIYSQQKGAKEAAKSITGALNRAAKAFYTWYDGRKSKPTESEVSKKITALWEEKVRPRLEHYRSLGASDTEPHNMTQEVLEKMATSKHGEYRIEMYQYNPVEPEREPNPAPSTAAALVSKLKF